MSILGVLTTTRFKARLVAAVGIAAVIAACDVHGISAPGTLASITVTPNATLAAFGGQQMVAVGYDADGDVVSISPTWAVIANGGTISETGMFSAGGVLGLFTNTVVASVGAISGRASITVTAGPMVSITLSPNPDSLPVGAQQQFVAVGRDAAGNIAQFTPTWSVIAGGGTISQAGAFTAGTVTGPYANTIQVSGRGITATATVVVTPGPLVTITVVPNPVTLAVGLTQLFAAVGRDANGNVVAMTPTWSVVSGGGTITPLGVFTAGATPGTFGNTVTATSGSVSGTATVTVSAGQLATITVTPTPISMAEGTTQQFTAVGRDVGGNIVAITPTWSAVASGGSINLTTGLFTAGGVAGTYANTVRASVGSLAGFATVVVTNGVVASITVTPTPVSVQTNGSVQFVAVGNDAGGNVFVIAPVWSVINGGGSINAGTGLFTAGASAGTFTSTIQATSGGVSGLATVTVTAVAPSLATITVTPNPLSLLINGTQQFAAVGRDGNGNTLPFAPAWSVINGGGAIDPILGFFTAGAVPGTYTNTVKATSGAISATATVTEIVSAPILAAITVTPNPVSVLTGGTQQFAAVGNDANGNPFAITPVWSVVNGGGSINASTGLFTAGGTTGTFTSTVKATSGTVSSFSTVTVTAVVPVLVSVTVTPNPDSLIVGAQQQFIAVGKDANGNAVAITPTWTVVASGGTVNATGLFTAGATLGTFASTVRATSGALSGTATVVVIAGPLASITVTPNPDSLIVGAQQQFIAVGKDANGNAVAITPTWTVVASGGTVNATGLFTAGATLGTFASTVRATSGALSGTATVVVIAGPLASITVTPNPDTLVTGGQQQFVAVGRDADGNTVPVVVTWSLVVNGGLLTTGGLFTAGATPGTFLNTIKAASGTVSGTATVTVIAGPLAVITVTPNPISMLAGGAQQFVAVGSDASGNPIVITPVWSVVNGGGTINSSTGAFTAGTTAGTFMSTIKATSGTVSGFATVTVTTVVPVVVSITVTPNPDTLIAGAPQQFLAVGKDVNGNTVAITPTWSVVASGGTVNPTGLFTAGTTPGTFTSTVKATSGALSGTATVVVIAGPLVSITVTPNPDTLAVGAQQQFVAVGKDLSGNTVAITPTWVLAVGGGVLTAGGLFTAGTTPNTFSNTIKATSGAVSGTATVVVIPGALASITVTPNPDTLAVGAQQQFVAVGKDASGNVIPIASTWSVVANGGTANATGLFTAGATPGTFLNTIKATSGAVSGTATVVVIPGALASITVTPNPDTVIVGAQQQFIAVGKDANGNAVAITPTWSVIAAGGTVSATGLFTAGATPGTFTNTVKATSGTVSGTATVVVIAGPLASITVTPNPDTLSVGAQQQFVAVGRDADGNTVPLTVTWSLVASGGVLTTGGLFTAGTTPGTFLNTIKATSGTVSGTATVTVIAGPLATITVAPNPISMLTSGTQQFVAVGYDASGNAIVITPVWSVVNGGGTINSSTGAFTAGTTAGTFTSTIKATSGTVSGFATVTVTAVVPVVVSVTVTPNPDTLIAGAQQQFLAVGKDVNGNTVAITPTWSVVAGGGTLNPTGLFTAGTTLGTFANTIRATSGALSGTATVVVIAGPLASITVTPNPDTLSVGAQQQFVAVGKDANGNVVPIVTTWSVVAGGGAVSGAGLFTAGVAPGTFINTVRASGGGLSGFATVTITVGPLASITVTPNPDTLAVGAQQQFVAVGKDASGNIVAITPTWVLAVGGGVLTAGGLFTAGTTPNTFSNTIKASSGAVSGTATVVVIPGPLASITVTPNPDTLAVGAQQQFVAVGKDVSGNIVAITPTWSLAAGGGVLTAGGLFTAGSTPNTFSNTIKASSGAVSGTATVVVIAGPLATITVTPNPATLQTNSTQQFAAIGTDANGNTVAITPTWSVVAGGGAIVSSGLFTAGTAPGTFTNTVEATSGGISGSATVLVTSVFNSAAAFAILASSGITCTGTGTVNGATGSVFIGSAPTPTVTGFPAPCILSGTIPSTAVVSAAQSDLAIAYAAAQAQSCNADLTGVDLGFYDGSSPAKTLAPGTYCFSSTAELTGTLTLKGSATAKWTFIVGTGLDAAGSSNVILSGGAIPDNVYWAAGTTATLNTSASFQGNIMAGTTITLLDGSTLLGRALSTGAAVTLTGVTRITKP